MNEYSARTYRASDDPSLQSLLAAHMQTDQLWPSDWVRRQGDLLKWLRDTADFGRWVAHDKNQKILAHVSVHKVQTSAKASKWTRLLNCETTDIAEIGKLVVHPDYRRTGISGITTRACIRQITSMGKIPVATAYDHPDADPSIAMMTKIGWIIIGRSLAQVSKRPILLLTPPQQLINAARQNKAVASFSELNKAG